jgi:hypothetical protein
MPASGPLNSSVHLDFLIPSSGQSGEAARFQKDQRCEARRDRWIAAALSALSFRRIDRSDDTFTTGAKNLKLARQARAYWEMIPADVSLGAFHSN